MGQSSGSLQQQIKAEEEYAEHMYDSVWLLQTTKKVISGVTQQSNVYHSTFCALKDLYNLRQKSDETVEEYFCHLKASTDFVQLSNGTQVFDNQRLIALEIGDDPNVTKLDVEQRFLAMMFIENACTVRYAALWKELASSTAMKMDKYPKTMSEATYLLTHWKAPNAHTTTNRNLTSVPGMEILRPSSASYSVILHLLSALKLMPTRVMMALLKAPMVTPMPTLRVPIATGLVTMPPNARRRGSNVVRTIMISHNFHLLTSISINTVT